MIFVYSIADRRDFLNLLENCELKSESFIINLFLKNVKFLVYGTMESRLPRELELSNVRVIEVFEIIINVQVLGD